MTRSLTTRGPKDRGRTGDGLPTTCAVALPLPTADPYTYSIPAALADRVLLGSRVVVPVRSREMVGIVCDVGESPREDLKAVLLAPDATPLLTPALFSLAGWISRYYATPVGVVLRAMVPGALWGTSRLVATTGDVSVASGGIGRTVMEVLEKKGGRLPAATLGRVLRRPVWDALQRLARTGAVELETEAPKLGPTARVQEIVVLKRALASLLERERTFGRAVRQREAYETIDALGGEVAARRLTHEFGFSRAIVRALVERGLAEIQRHEELRDPFSGVAATPPDMLTADQELAVQRLGEVAEGRAATLFGVTGSGKTLVYLHAMRMAVERGRGAIVLVPEIALTPQTIARVRGMFGDAVAVLHSGLSDGERADAWRVLASGRRRVAVGARSAVFAPVRDLGAIILDEEHDASYKNGESPRYHARDVALRRAHLEKARLILGSATPSLETWHVRDLVPVVSLPQRVTAHALPDVQLVDLRAERRVDGSGPVPWTVPLDDAVEDRLERGEQIILLLNRRGFAHFLQCTSCGDVPECGSCSIALTVHRTPSGLRCHYCGHERAIPHTCGVCGGETQRTRGVGTQSLERWLTQRYATARLARMDADTTATKWSHSRILDEFALGEVDILFGTQMIAKGLDFPGVTLVGVVNADTGLHLPDFRSSERTFQLIAQVAGRAGRGPAGGVVLVQTRMPQHYALQYAAQHDFEGFAARELEERTGPAYPPHVGLVNIVVSGGPDTAVARGAGDLAEWVRGLVAARAPEVEVLGPAPAPLSRIKGRWRWHLVLRSADRNVLGRVMRYAAGQGPHTGRGRLRVTFDRDPVSLL